MTREAIYKKKSPGSYSTTNPNLWIETTAIQSRSITTSTNIAAGVDIYATDRIIKGKNLEITSSSTFARAIGIPTVNLSSVEYSDSSRLDKLKM